MSFKVGDRIRTRENKRHSLSRGPFIGTVVDPCYMSGIAAVTRDDGIEGGGPYNSWIVRLDCLELLPEVARSFGVDEASQHVAGLSPERVDWNKVMHGRWDREEE